MILIQKYEHLGEKADFYGTKANTKSHIFSSIYDSGPRLNIKTVLSTYGDFHVKDKTAVRTSYL